MSQMNKLMPTHLIRMVLSYKETLNILGFFDDSFLLLIFALGVFICTEGFDFYLVEFINLMCHGF